MIPNAKIEALEKAGEGTSREHIEQLHQTATGLGTQLGKELRINAGQYHIGTCTVNQDQQNRRKDTLSQILDLPDVFYRFYCSHRLC